MTLEVQTELASSFRISNDAKLAGKRVVVCRVKYRPKGTRRWTRFTLVPDPDQDVIELQDLAFEAAQLHAERRAQS